MTMLQEAINRSGQSPQEFAQNIHYSRDAVYKACQGNRRIPADAKRDVARLNILGGMAVAHESTGYCIFQITEGDKHPQTMIRRLEKEDMEADTAMRSIPYIIIDAESAADLSPEDRTTLKQAMKELADRIHVELNILVEMDDRYDLGSLEYLLRKKDR